MREKESPRRTSEQEAPQQERPLTPEELAGDGPELESSRREREGSIPLPSQAEGDRETVEEDLRSKEQALERERRPEERQRGTEQHRSTPGTESSRRR